MWYRLIYQQYTVTRKESNRFSKVTKYIKYIVEYKKWGRKLRESDSSPFKCGRWSKIIGH